MDPGATRGAEEELADGRGCVNFHVRKIGRGGAVLPGPRPPFIAFCGGPCLIPMRDAHTCGLPFTSNIPSNGGKPREEAAMKPPGWEDREHASIEGLLFSLDSCLTSSDLSVIYAVLNFPTRCVTANQPLAHRPTTPNSAIPNKVGGRPPTADRHTTGLEGNEGFGLWPLSHTHTHPASLLPTQPLDPRPSPSSWHPHPT